MEDEVPDHRLSILMLGFLVGAVGAFFLAVQGDLATAANDDAPPAQSPAPAPASETIRPGTVLTFETVAVLSVRRA